MAEKVWQVQDQDTIWVPRNHPPIGAPQSPQGPLFLKVVAFWYLAAVVTGCILVLLGY